MGDDPVDTVAHPPPGRPPGRGHPGGDIMGPLEAAFGEQQGQVQVPFILQVTLQLIALGQDRRSPGPGRDCRPHSWVTLQQADRGPAGRGAPGCAVLIG